MVDFSVVIPTKNEERNISTCLRSIFSITYPQEKYEVIVVDNGSTDQTVAVAESAGARVVQIPDVNISALRNFGAQLAQGQVLAFVDADCTVAKDWLQQASRYLTMQEVALFGSPPGIPQDSTWVQRTWFFVRNRNTQNVIEVSWLESMNMFIPRQLFLQIEGFNENLVTCEDVDISYRLAAYGKIISDVRIRAIHHGEARTLREFFFKEKWRGKSNYAGLRIHGLHQSEIPSLILPIYYLLMPVLTVIAWLLFGSLYVVFWGGFAWQFPLLVIVFLKLGQKGRTFTTFVRLWILYNVYYMARATAII